MLKKFSMEPSSKTLRTGRKRLLQKQVKQLTKQQNELAETKELWLAAYS